MSEEHLPALSSWGQLGDPPKRRRTPSHYATHIADFKNDLALNSKRPRSIRIGDQPCGEHVRSGQAKPLLCTLPDGRTYRLSIVATKPSSSQRPDKRKLKRVESAVSNPPQEEKKAEASVCLLDKFLSAFQNLKKEDEAESKSNNEASKQNVPVKPIKREERIPREREREDKWSKCYQRYVGLSDRLERLQETYIFLI